MRISFITCFVYFWGSFQPSNAAYDWNSGIAMSDLKLGFSFPKGQERFGGDFSYFL